VPQPFTYRLDQNFDVSGGNFAAMQHWDHEQLIMHDRVLIFDENVVLEGIATEPTGMSGYSDPALPFTEWALVT
jgi:hypothetical protein